MSFISVSLEVPEAALPSLYGCADVFAMVCRNRWMGLEQEGFGIVFLEAMRFGRPCVGGRAGGAPEAVEDGRTGLLVDFLDAAGLEAALDRLLGDTGLRRRMGEAGRSRVAEHFTFERFRERLREALTEWLASP